MYLASCSATWRRAKRYTQHAQCWFKCLCASLSLAPHPKKISKHAPQKNQKAFAYGTEAGSGSHLANQEASGAGKAFAYGTGAGGRSHLAKLRDGARHCAELYAALRDGARHCNSALSLSFLLRAKPGARAACTWARSSTVINTERRTGPTRRTAAAARWCATL